MSSVVLSGDTSGTVTITVPAVAGTNTVTVPAGTGTMAVQNVSTNIVSGTVVASTSGTAIDFTSIPSWVKQITVMFNGVSLSTSTPYLRVQIGAGSVDTSSYTGASGGTNNNPAASWLTQYTNGFDISLLSAAADTMTGQLVLSSFGSNIWVMSSVIARNSSVTSAVHMSGGVKTLSGALDRVRITTSDGTTTFDAGSINILYE